MANLKQHTPPQFPVPRGGAKNWLRNKPATPVLKHAVEMAHLQFVEEGPPEDVEEYNRFTDSINNNEAVEGSVTLDRGAALRVLRGYALEQGNVLVGKAQLAPLVKALEQVLKAYGQGTRQRQLALKSGQTATSNGRTGS